MYDLFRSALSKITYSMYVHYDGLQQLSVFFLAFILQCIFLLHQWYRWSSYLDGRVFQTALNCHTIRCAQIFIPTLGGFVPSLLLHMWCLTGLPEQEYKPADRALPSATTKLPEMCAFKNQQWWKQTFTMCMQLLMWQSEEWSNVACRILPVSNRASRGL